jgi:hypothetical protein
MTINFMPDSGLFFQGDLGSLTLFKRSKEYDPLFITKVL